MRLYMVYYTITEDDQDMQRANSVEEAANQQEQEIKEAFRAEGMDVRVTITGVTPVFTEADVNEILNYQGGQG